MSWSEGDYLRVNQSKLARINGHEAIEFASLAGEILLENGAETSRVEDTINRICIKAGFKETEVIVFPTGMIINAKHEGEGFTKAKRILSRDINLKMVSCINDISRKFSNGQISLAEGIRAAREAHEMKGKAHFWGILLAGASASAAATLLLGGSKEDVLPAFIATAIVRFVMGITAYNLAYVLQIYVAGFLAGVIGVFFVRLGFGLDLGKIIVGALLPLVPGVSLTNAVRDFISGDLLSGTLRMVEAFLVSAALAGGVGLALALYAGRLSNTIF